MATYEKEFLLKVLENLWKVRKFEQRAMEGGLKGEIKGNIHVCLGEEGAVVGANMALEPTDYITASHRGHGHCVMKSDDLEHTLAELYGKESGFCHGRGGSMHVTKVESGLLGANGIVGGGIPLATGSALASKINHDGAVSVAFFGDGASNQGCFHECINMAAVWKLPIVYFIENNQFAVSTDIHTTCATPTLAQRAQGYGIEGIIVDGTCWPSTRPCSAPSSTPAAARDPCCSSATSTATPAIMWVTLPSTCPWNITPRRTRTM